MIEMKGAWQAYKDKSYTVRSCGMPTDCYVDRYASYDDQIVLTRCDNALNYCRCSIDELETALKMGVIREVKS